MALLCNAVALCVYLSCVMGAGIIPRIETGTLNHVVSLFFGDAIMYTALHDLSDRFGADIFGDYSFLAVREWIKTGQMSITKSRDITEYGPNKFMYTVPDLSHFTSEEHVIHRVSKDQAPAQFTRTQTGSKMLGLKKTYEYKYSFDDINIRQSAIIALLGAILRDTNTFLYPKLDRMNSAWYNHRSDEGGHIELFPLRNTLQEEITRGVSSILQTFGECKARDSEFFRSNHKLLNGLGMDHTFQSADDLFFSTLTEYGEFVSDLVWWISSDLRKTVSAIEEQYCDRDVPCAEGYDAQRTADYLLRNVQMFQVYQPRRYGKTPAYVHLNRQIGSSQRVKTYNRKQRDKERKINNDNREADWKQRTQAWIKVYKKKKRSWDKIVNGKDTQEGVDGVHGVVLKNLQFVKEEELKTWKTSAGGKASALIGYWDHHTADDDDYEDDSGTYAFAQGFERGFAAALKRMRNE